MSRLVNRKQFKYRIYWEWMYHFEPKIFMAHDSWAMSLRVKFESNSGKYPVGHNWFNFERKYSFSYLDIVLWSGIIVLLGHLKFIWNWGSSTTVLYETILHCVSTTEVWGRRGTNWCIAAWRADQYRSWIQSLDPIRLDQPFSCWNSARSIFYQIEWQKLTWDNMNNHCSPSNKKTLSINISTNGACLTWNTSISSRTTSHLLNFITIEFFQNSCCKIWNTFTGFNTLIICI